MPAFLCYNKNMIFAENRKAKFNYQIVDRFEAGIQLSGQEVKAIRAGKVNLDSTFAIVRGGEIFLIGTQIQPFQEKNAGGGYDKERTRKLLIKKTEIKKLEKILHEQKLTLIGTMLYNKGRNIKIEIALGKGKKEFDKRETIKKRDVEKEINRLMKNKR